MKGMQRICAVLPFLLHVILEMAELILPEHPSSHGASAAILNCFIFSFGTVSNVLFFFLIAFVWLHLYHAFGQTNFAFNLISSLEESNCLF